MEKNIRRCEVCGRVYDSFLSNGFFEFHHSRCDDNNRRRSGGASEYKTCIECHDKISKAIEDLVHGGM